MPTYLNVTFNHFAALQAWAGTKEAELFMDMKDLTLHVRRGNRACRMFPMFQAEINGNFCHVQSLTPYARGFGGWRPYEMLTHTHTRDKTLFKQFLAARGLNTPGMSDGQGSPPPSTDYVLKAKSGSFGRGLFGPYRAGRWPDNARDKARDNERAASFAEQFVPGRMLKVWYWGSKPFFAHVQDYPRITGDGETATSELVRRELVAARVDPEAYGELPLIFDCLAYQRIASADVMASGRTAWIDYRYNRLYSRDPGGASRASDNGLQELQEATGRQLQEMGEALASLLRETIALPVATTADGVLDADGRIWWLEMNTNSVLPPEGYAVMFEDVFP